MACEGFSCNPKAAYSKEDSAKLATRGISTVALRDVLDNACPEPHAHWRAMHAGKKHTFGGGDVGRVTAEVYEALTAIQQQRADDPYGWVYEV